MYDELIKDLREIAPKALAEADFDFVEGWLKEAADAIEKLKKLHETQKKNLSVITDAYMKSWIPVTERLPKADEYDARGYAVPYLVMNGWMRVTARRTKDYWVLFGNGTVLEYVTHWMPLPEPPKEE